MKVYNGTLSSSNLYHFTREKKNIKSILENGFYPRTSIEDLSFLMHNYTKAFVGIPMVCFCDIPLNLIEEHTLQYGDYGIGLSKEWGIEKGLNPVHYILDKNVIETNKYNKIEKIDKKDRTLISNVLLNLQQVIIGNARCLDYIENGYFLESGLWVFNHSYKRNLYIIANAFWNFAGYLKLYTDNYDEKPYYDEREWRYIVEFFRGNDRINRIEIKDEKVNKCIKKYNENVINIKKSKQPIEFKSLQQFVKEDKEVFEQVEKLNKLMEKKEEYRLKFQTEDIEEIIVRNENEKDEIIEVIDSLNQICGNKIMDSDKKSLIDKIKVIDDVLFEDTIRVIEYLKKSHIEGFSDDNKKYLKEKLEEVKKILEA